jgi:hypothetical protein
LRGYCPKGRKADDGPIAEIYPLIELAYSDYPARTKQNIISSDGTLILFTEILDRGSELTMNFCTKLSKPLWLQSMNQELSGVNFRKWILESGIKTLNIAGPRERFSPGIYLKTLIFLNSNFSTMSY